MMSIGLHCRLAGRPGRAVAIRKFLEHARKHEGVWFASRLDIARHWARTHPYRPRARPSEMAREDFVATFGGVYGNAPWIAERVWDGEMGAIHDTPKGLAARMAQILRAASDEERLGLLRAHPDLGEKLSGGDGLTDAARAEAEAQAGRIAELRLSEMLGATAADPRLAPPRLVPSSLSIGARSGPPIDVQRLPSPGRGPAPGPGLRCPRRPAQGRGNGRASSWSPPYPEGQWAPVSAQAL